jgi:hypothetical protein
MLIKLIHKLHHQQESSWARWVQSNACIASLTGDLHGQHWDMLRSLLPIYRAITSVALGDGQNTSFWHDVWHEQDSMAEKFPQLFTHCKDQEMTVSQAVEGALQPSLVHRRSSVAQQQLAELTTIVEQINLQQGRDKRLSPWLKRNGDLDTSLLYGALRMNESGEDVWAKFIWKSKAPPRVQFFAWLLSQGKIQCRTNLVKKKIVETAECEICHEADETAAHVIFGCTAAKEFWDAVQITTDRTWTVDKLLEITVPGHIPGGHFSTFITLCCWHIWKRRNNIAFRNDRVTIQGALMACKAEASLWKCRLPKKDRGIADVWCSILLNAM